MPDQQNEPLQQEAKGKEQTLHEQSILQMEEQLHEFKEQIRILKDENRMLRVKHGSEVESKQKDLQLQLRIKTEGLDNALKQHHAELATQNVKNESLRQENAKYKHELLEKDEKIERIVTEHADASFNHLEDQIVSDCIVNYII